MGEAHQFRNFPFREPALHGIRPKVAKRFRVQIRQGQAVFFFKDILHGAQEADLVCGRVETQGAGTNVNVTLSEAKSPCC
jgi:hypothetical protein